MQTPTLQDVEKFLKADAVAREAIARARKLRGQWEAFARMLTGNPKLRLVLTADRSQTDGDTIWIRVPAELADLPPHDISNCGQRNEMGLQSCSTCRVLEYVDTVVFHEIAHIVFDSFDSVTERDVVKITSKAIMENCAGKPDSPRAKRLAAELEELRKTGQLSTYWVLSYVVSPYLQTLLNAMEDMRVNARMVEARPGTLRMFQALYTESMVRGSLGYDGEIVEWRDQPPNAQIAVAFYCMVSDLPYKEHFSEKIGDDLDDPEVQALAQKVREASDIRTMYTLTFPLLEAFRRLGYMKVPDEPEEEEPPATEPEPDTEENDEQAQDGDSDQESDDDQPDDREEEVPGSDQDDDGDVDPDGEAGDEDQDDPRADSPGEQDNDPADDAGEPEGGGEDAGGQDPAEDHEDRDADADPPEGSDGSGDDSVDDGSPGDPDEPSSVDDGADGAPEGQPQDDGEGSPSDPADDNGELTDDGADEDRGDDPGDGTEPGSADPADAGDDGAEGDDDQSAADDGEGAGQPDPEPGDQPDADGEPAPGGDEAGDGESGPQDAPSPAPSGDEPGDADGDDPQPGGSDGSGDGDESPAEGEGQDGGEPGSSEVPGDGQSDGDGGPEAPASDSVDGDGDSSSDGVSIDPTGADSDPQGGDTPGDPTAPDGPDSADVDGPGEGGNEPPEPAPYTQEQYEADGTPEEVQRILKTFSGHGDEVEGGEPIFKAILEEASADAKEASGEPGDDTSLVMAGDDEGQRVAITEAIQRALAQMDFFDIPSLNIEGVDEVRYDADEVAAEGRYGRGSFETGQPDIEVPSSVTAPALNRLRMLFTENRKRRNEKHLRKGKLHGASLGRRAPVDDDRMFQKRQLPAKKDYFVVIGLDVSGSTGSGNRIQILKESAYAMADMLSKLHIPFAVYAHTGGRVRSTVGIYIVKDEHEPWGKKQKEALSALCPSSANLDGHTLEYYRKVAQRSKAERRMIFYYTDGAMPLANFAEELVILQKEIDICRRLDIDLIGVGVHTDSPKEHGLDTVLLEDLSDTPKMVAELQRRLSR